MLLLELEFDELLDELFDDELLELLEELFEDRLDELLELRFDELLFDRFELEFAELLEEPLEELFADELLELFDELFDELLEDRFDELLADPLELLFELLLDAPERLPRSPPSRCRPTADAARFMPFSQPLKKRCTGVSPRLSCWRVLRELLLEVLLEELLDEFLDEFELLLEALKPFGPRAPRASWAALETWRTGLVVWAWVPLADSRPTTAVTMIPMRFFMELPRCRS